jgi:phosphoribosylaminoimidazole (AIR) synthetase
VLCVARADARRVRARLERLGETVYEIGAIEKGKGEPAARVI